MHRLRHAIPTLLLALPLDALAAQRPGGPPARLEFEARLGPLRVGTAVLTTGVADTLDGTPVEHATLHLTGGRWRYRLDDRIEAWLDASSGSTLRARRRVVERDRPDSSEWNAPVAARATDEVGLLRRLARLPLAPGDTLRLPSIRGPEDTVTVVVLARETIEAPGGRRMALVVAPIVPGRGVLGAEAGARLWLSDDAERLPLRIRLRTGSGTITLALRRVEGGDPPLSPE